MTKKFRLENLDCANCAAKMERKINKVDGVNSATVNFMTQKLTIDFDESREAEIMEKSEKIMKCIESGIIIKRG